MAYSQPAIEWQHCYGGSADDVPTCIFQTSDGGYLVAGQTSSNDIQVVELHGEKYSDDCWVVKLNSKGIIQWQRPIGGLKTEQLSACIQTFDGGYILTGYTNSIDGDIQDRKTNDDSLHILVCKLNPKGVLEWEKTYGEFGSSLGSTIVQTSDHGFVLSGYDHGGFVLKTDSVGSIQWKKYVGDFMSIIPTDDNGFIGCASIYVTSQAGKKNSNAYVAKLDSTGNTVWQKNYGGSGDDYAANIIQVRNGELPKYAICGSTSSNDGDVVGYHPDTNGWQDGWVFMINASGDLIWQKPLGGSEWDDCASIKQTNDGQLIIMGSSSSNDGDVSEHYGDLWNFCPWLIKLSTKGDILWEHAYRTLPVGSVGPNYGKRASPTSDNGYIFTTNINSNGGDVTGFHGSYNTDFWVVKLAPEVSAVSLPSALQENISISPNPTTGIGKINYTLAESSSARFEIYNMLGQRIEMLSDNYEQSGIHSLPFDLSRLSTGTYFLRSEIHSASRTVPFEISR